MFKTNEGNPPENILGGIKLAKDRAIPDGTELQVRNIGERGFVYVDIKLPWQKIWTDLGRLPIINREIVLPLKLVFLCHAKEDVAVVQEVGDRLLQDGFLTWFDQKDLLPGDRWETKIEEAIEGSDYVIVFLSRSSCSKEGFVQKEIKLAMEQHERKPTSRRFIIPVLVEKCEVPREFREIHYLGLWEDNAYEHLKAALMER